MAEYTDLLQRLERDNRILKGLVVRASSWPPSWLSGLSRRRWLKAYRPRRSC